MNNKIERLAKANGVDAVFNQTIEECAELIVRIRHFARFGMTEKLTQLNDVWEEIADVEIMLEQLKYHLYSSNAVDNIKAQKIERQLARFGLTGTGK
ncbi:MAG: hypothetical protein IKU47_08075 [Oscillospiraceae bacterium]|nr:hypothetical protein [Oscillospiraceae bacterium]